MKKLVAILLLLTFYNADAAVLKGTVLMHDSSAASFSNIHLFHYLKDSAVHKNSTVANLEGLFSLQLKTKEWYKIEIDALGSGAFSIDSISLTKDSTIASIVMSQGTKIETVIITAKEEAAQIKLDKKVFKVSENPSSTGGSAIDVLANLPSVDVDQDGNISLRGNGNIRVLIDGKPSGINASDLSAVLEQIPASSIENIEIVTVPSARYDAESSGGVINITLKENKLQGLRGSGEISFGSWDKWNGNLTLGLKTKRQKLNLNYGFRTGTFFRERNANSKNATIDTLDNFANVGNGEFINPSHIAKLSYDLKMDSSFSLGISGTANLNNKVQENTNLYTWNYKNGNVSSSERNSSTEQEQQRYIGSFSLEKKLNKGYLRSTSIFSNLNSENKGSFNEENVSQSEQGNTLSRDFIQKLDYHQLRSWGDLTAGGQFTHRVLKNDYQFFESSTLIDSIANQLDYWDQISAGYIEYKNSINNWSFTLGHRVEYTHLHSINTNNNLDVVKHYWMHFPSLNLSKDFGEKDQIGFNYSRRITRPNAIQLNPSPSLSDPYSLHTGNPDLIPATNDINELTWLHKEKKVTFQSTLFYQLRLNRVRRIRFVDKNGISNVKWMNYDREDYYGIEVFSNVKLSNYIDFNFTINAYERMTDGSNIGAGYTARYFGWDGKGNLNIRLLKDWQLFFNGVYKSPKAIVIGTIDERYFIDAGLKKTWLGGKLVSSIRLSDIFNTRDFDITTFVDDWDQNGTYKRESRILFLAMKYKFKRQPRNILNSK